MTPRALVTGANGFLGSRLIRFLVTRGERVKAFVRAGSNLSALCGLPEQQVELCMGDITSGHTVYRALAGCNRLYHIAAGYTPWQGGARPVLERAVLGTREVLEAARRRNIEKIVVTSSAATLGSTPHADLMDEGHDFNLPGADPALVAKHRAESVALEQASLGMPVVVVKPTVVSGPGDWRPTPSGGVLLRYLNWPTSRRLRIPKTGGLNIVDVDDVAAGHHLAMLKGRVGERYILGGENLDLGDLVQGVLPEATGLSPAFSTVSPSRLMWTTRVLEASARLRGGTPPMASARMLRDQICRYVWVSSAKAERELGYTHRPALEALARGVRWYEEQGYVSSSNSKAISNGRHPIAARAGDAPPSKTITLPGQRR